MLPCRFECANADWELIMNLNYKIVPVDSVYSLRHQVLRPGQPLTSCYYNEDKEDSAFHFAALNGKDVVGISSFYCESNDSLPEGIAFRLRGMAIEPSLQSHGIGTNLLTQAIDICKKAGADLLWCNARVDAKNFYQRIGFKAVGGSFNLDGIGEHYLMYRELI